VTDLTLDLGTLWQAERPHLIGVAYRMLGSIAEAEDVVQSAWLKIAGVDPQGLREPRAYFTTVVVRTSLDALKSARVRRESYVGPWLPEPVLTDADGFVAQSEPRDLGSISFAFLILLEALSPLERAAFLLHEVFDWSAKEIGGVLERDEAAVRQLVSRARAHVSEGAPRFTPAPEAHHALLQGFLVTMASGDVNALAAMLAEDATVRSDGGGMVRAARKTVSGRLNVAKLLVGVMRHMDYLPELLFREVNGAPSIVFRRDERTEGVLSLTIEGAEITQVHLVLSPEKLGHLTLA
jgi:RNA polymerase sigma-70 factor, ECF subfamily